MSDDLLRTLRLYEEDYRGQPIAAQRADLPIINELRARLGMPLVDAQLCEIEPAPRAEIAPAEKAPTPAAPDHEGARRIYQAYLERVAELERHRAFAARVAKATSGSGQTPVRPLATMGTGGGPLLCDHCGKPIVLEGGEFHGMTADAAWKKNPREDFRSWILGGLVVEITTNGTLRVYHGYPHGGRTHCCNAALHERERALAQFTSKKSRDTRDKLRALLEEARADMTREERDALVEDIVRVMFDYDPGLGVNRP